MESFKLSLEKRDLESRHRINWNSFRENLKLAKSQFFADESSMLQSNQSIIMTSRSGLAYK